MENAVRHGAGIVTVVVTARAGVSGDQQEAITVSVRDQGEGIPPEMSLRVFRQFWRGKRRGGTGLGLYIVKGLVEAMDGEIAVARAPGGGAEFRFTLPAGTPPRGEPCSVPCGRLPGAFGRISPGGDPRNPPM